MDFPSEVLLPGKTIFEPGSVVRLAAESACFGSSGLIVHGASLARSGMRADILAKFSSAHKVECFCRNKGEPTLSEVAEVISQARNIRCDWIAGIGGGSVLDLAKAAAGLYNAQREPSFYQEGGELEEPGIAFIAIPTTCGSGAEATPNAVIINQTKAAKLSIRDKSFLARLVILDPALVYTLPQEVLNYSALDALVQAYESYISRNATWLSQALSMKALSLINDNILAAREPGAKTSRANLLLASYLAGIALSLARLGVIHGIAHPLGALYGIPHGLICARGLEPSILLNRAVITNKYDEMSRCVRGDFLARVRELLTELQVQNPFGRLALREREKIIIETLASGSTAANPKQIAREDVEKLLGYLFGAPE